MQRFQLNMLGLGQLKQPNCMAQCLTGKEVKINILVEPR